MQNSPLATLEERIAQNREEHGKASEQASYWIGEKKRLDFEFTYLNQSYRLAGGIPFKKEEPAQPIAQIAEEILRQHGKMHADELTARMGQAPYHRPIEKQSVVGTLVRYVARGEVFERVGKNTFDLLGRSKEGSP